MVSVSRKQHREGQATPGSLFEQMLNVPPVWTNIMGSSMDAATDDPYETIVPCNEDEEDVTLKE